jgi:formyl-CoA transferase
VGDATRKQLVDVEGADSLYFTMLNHNKRSLTQFCTGCPRSYGL